MAEILEIEELRKSEEFLNIILNNLNSSVFILTRDRVIKDANRCGLALLNKNDEAIFNNIFGNALECMYTVEGKLQCGFTPHCAQCKLKEACEKIYNKEESFIQNIFDKKEIVHQGQHKQKTFLYSARLVKYKGQEMILLVVDDITKLEKQKQVIAEQKAQIESSIRYAMNIQNALLPAENDFTSLFDDYFLLYEQKDYLGGDFYWLHENNERIILAVGDCTGHGVPGAMLSVLGITTLNDIVKSQKIDKPDAILNRLRIQVIDILNHRFETTLTDGMDISLCVLDKKHKQIAFSGANSKICLIQEDTIIEVKGDKMPIGIFDTMNEFKMHRIPYSEGDMLYMYTDGFKDQFGGIRNKKIGRKRFNNILKKVSKEQAYYQKIFLMDYFNRWKGRSEQTDDVTLTGIRL